MKRFLKKIAIWITLIPLVYYVIGLFPFFTFNRSYPIYKSQLEFIDSDSADILFIGDSRVMSSIVPNQIPNSRNLGIVGTSPIDGYFLLKKYLKKSNNQVKTVFISYAWERLGNEYYPEIINLKGVPMGLYNYEDYNELMNKANIVDPEFSKHLNLKDFLMAKMNSPITIGHYLRNFKFSNYSTNKSIYKLIDSQNGHITSIWGKKRNCSNCVGFEANMDRFKLKPIYDFYLQELIKLCVSKKIKVIFETIPFNKSAKINNKVNIAYKKYLRKLSKLVPEAKLSDTIFYYPDNYYEDPHHMKPEGAAIYTEYLNLKYFDLK